MIILCSIAAYIPLRMEADRSGGRIGSVKRENGESSISVDLQLSYEGEEYSTSTELTVLAEGEEVKEKTYEVEQQSFLEAYADKIIRELNNDSSGSELVLPSESEGVSMIWTQQKKEDPVWIFAVSLLLCTFLWFSKDDALKLRRKLQREELVNELPNMILQLILLLNAGLIADAAFDELVRQNRSENNYLYRVMNVLQKRAEEENTLFIPLMYSFAKDFGNRDLLRFATLCAEHSHRGSELASKLEQERGQQWNGRLNRARARAKEAETKLCFPLMLLLIALVVICIAPALFEMQG